MQVAHWLSWATGEFSLEGISLQQFHMRGKDICAMGKEAFLARTPPFMGDILWEHLEILQKGKLNIMITLFRSSNDFISVLNIAFMLDSYSLLKKWKRPYFS